MRKPSKDLWPKWADSVLKVLVLVVPWLFVLRIVAWVVWENSWIDNVLHWAFLAGIGILVGSAMVYRDVQRKRNAGRQSTIDNQ